MQIMNDINWRVLERELQRSLSDRFRRVWIGYTRFGSVQFTLFPVNLHESYRIVTRSKFIDVNKNVYAYLRSFVPDVTFATPPTEEDRVRASEMLTTEFVRVFTNEINTTLPPAP